MFRMTTKLYGQPIQEYSPIPDSRWLEMQRDGLSALFGWTLGRPEIVDTGLGIGPIYSADTGQAIGIWSVRPITTEV